MIQDKLKDNKIALKFNAHNNTCKIYSDKTLNLKEFGLLLGFPLSYTVLPKVWKTSLYAVDINLGLRYVTLLTQQKILTDKVDEVKHYSHFLYFLTRTLALQYCILVTSEVPHL